MNWNQTELAIFFGYDPSKSNVGINAENNYILIDESMFSYLYSGPLLQYQLIVSPDNCRVAISADTNPPFGGNSLYEVCITCDSIVTFPDPYYLGQTALGFWNGDLSDAKNCRFTIMKRPDGELKVWAS